jgi:hypothetical protein
MLERTARLECDAAVQRLYEVFESYRFRSDMPCCIPHCFEQSELDMLGAKPLHLLEASQLSSFAFSLLLTSGEVDDFKHFLPRLFELTAQNVAGFVTAEIVIGKLAKADWQTWPDLERAAVGDFLWAWWRLALELDENGREDCFAGLCCTGDDPSPYLRMWRDLEGPRYAVMLARFVNQHATVILAGRRFNSFVSKAAMQAIEGFLREPATRARFETAFYGTKNRDDLKTLSLAEQLVQF